MVVKNNFINKSLRAFLNNILYIAGAFITLSVCFTAIRSCTSYGFETYQKPKIEEIAKVLDSENIKRCDEKMLKITSNFEKVNKNIEVLMLNSTMNNHLLKQIATEKQWKVAQEKTKQDSINAAFLSSKNNGNIENY